MKFILEPKASIDRRFVEFLIERIQERLYENITIDNLKLYQNYLDSKENFPKIDLYKAILDAVDNVKIKETDTSYIIQLDEDKYVEGTDIRLVTLCSLVDSGVLGLVGYNLFTNVFHRFELELVRYYKEYLEQEL